MSGGGSGNDPREAARLRPARPADRAAVHALLEAAGLPVAGVDAWFPRFVVAEAAGGIAGVAGLEAHGSDGLLRSVAVAEAWRGRGLGIALTEEVARRAAAEGLEALYLLTETAEAFFARQGFRRIDRQQASEAVRQSVEFRELCPASSTVMVRPLPPL